MSESDLPDSAQRVRPASGILALMFGIAASMLFYKGYTIPGPGAVWLRLLHVIVAGSLFFWGLKTILVGRKRYQANSWVSRFMPYRIEVTREGWLYFVIMIAVLMGALIGKSNLLLLVFGLLAGPFVLNGYIALMMLARNHVVRQLPTRAMQGDWFSVDLTLSNTRWFIGSWMMVVEDHWKSGSEYLFPVVIFSRVGPGQERTGRYQLRLQPRGRHVCGPVRLMTRFPLGLVERSYTMNCPGEILIYPRIGRLTSQWHREHVDADELVQHARPRSGAFEDEFHRLRDYRPGDSLRSIHWRTTARRNQLMVREHHQMRDLDLALILDLWLPQHPTAEERAHVELALSFAATVCVEHCQKSRESSIFVGIVGHSARHWNGAAGPQTIPQLLDEFALAEGGGATELAKIADTCCQMRTAHVHRLLITTRHEHSPSIKLVHDVVADSQRRGMPLRVITAQPETMNRYLDTTVNSSAGDMAPLPVPATV